MNNSITLCSFLLLISHLCTSIHLLALRVSLALEHMAFERALFYSSHLQSMGWNAIISYLSHSGMFHDGIGIWYHWDRKKH
jgi:hypothetical protein